jgi:3-hydroxyisobutyrate dehydrogenase-like beta-hydroxyacid dehydrogenase
MKKVGFVGLGAMGGRMAERLISRGRTVIGYNRTKGNSDWLVAKGLIWADSPREVAERSDLVFSMVTDTAAVEFITQGGDGIIAGISAEKIYVDMSTISPAYSRALAEQVESAGGFMLDAPVSGSVVTLTEGKLSIMVGGEKGAFDKALPVLKDIGSKVTHTGAVGSAVTLKIAINLGLAVQMLAFSESILLAEKAGIPRELAVEVLANSVTGSPMVKYRGPFVLGHPEKAMFDCSMMQKDLNLAMELGRRYSVPLPTTTLTAEYVKAAKAMGLGHYDFAILFDVLAQMAGIDKKSLRPSKEAKDRR